MTHTHKTLPDLNNLSLQDIAPVFLAGGEGKRLWPLSRRTRPKPFLKLGRARSFLQNSLLRTRSMRAPLIVCATPHRHLAVPQVREIESAFEKKAEIIFEPCGRNTAPAIAVAAHRLFRQRPENPPMLVMPSDHIIKDEALFLAAVEKALSFIDDNKIITFGIQPRYAASGYGYIRKGEQIEGDLYRVDHFHEKPDKSRAAFYLKKGEHLWNSGIFLARASCFLKAFELYTPQLSAESYTALAKASSYNGSVFITEEDYRKIESASIDHAVIERAQNIAVMPVDMRWRDIGTWPSFISYMLGI